ncbi:serine hydrolase [Spirosoma liriopis]|uniref:serine hydrolase n=1 Tax=Spirosoma liriopis TaxID=2937440 RepID=UPI00338D9CF5
MSDANRGHIEHVSGQKLADFAREYLFTTLAIREVYWYTGSSGQTAPMGNLYLSTLDMAKIGQLMLNKGAWHGQQLISSAWISWVEQQQFTLSNWYAQGYGYYWYHSSKSIGRTTYAYWFASGNGGNLLFVVPQVDLVVSLTSSAYGQGYGHQRSHTIFELVLKALIDR